MDTTMATEESKTALENLVSWYLADKLHTAATPIATVKYLTNNNLLVYLTRCNVAETTIPQVKVQVFQRVDGGVNETGYQLYGNHRFEKFTNNMIFGNTPDGSTPPSPAAVTEPEAKELLVLVNSLQTEGRQTL